MSSSFKRRGKRPPGRPGAGAAPSLPSGSPAAIVAPAAAATGPPSHLPGTRPWTGGQTLTSSGSREFDSLVLGGGGGGGGGGGQPLRTSVLIEEDRLADDLARCLCRTWCAEGVAQVGAGVGF